MKKQVNARTIKTNKNEQDEHRQTMNTNAENLRNAIQTWWRTMSNNKNKEHTSDELPPPRKNENTKNAQEQTWAPTKKTEQLRRTITTKNNADEPRRTMNNTENHEQQ